MHFRKNSKLKEVKVGLSSAEVSIAFFQLEGPSSINTPISGWDNVKDNKLRFEKIDKSLKRLFKRSSPDILIFPEYCFNSLEYKSYFQQKADENNTIIVSSADVLKSGRKKFNLTLVFLPERKRQIKIYKSKTSYKENQHVDDYEDQALVKFSWKCELGKTYWFVIYTCLDYLRYAIQDSFVHKLKGPGIYIVPMASTKIMDFLIHADIHKRNSGGVATIFANAIGQFGIGNSGVSVYEDNRKRNSLAFDLANNNEAYCLFDLKLTSLRKSSLTSYEDNYSISNIQRHDIEIKKNNITINESEEYQDYVTYRGVFNPNLFQKFRKVMRVAFLNSNKYSSQTKSLKFKPFESLAVFGDCDFIVTHVNKLYDDMKYDLEHAGFELGDSIDKDSKRNIIPHFEVEEFIKVIGVNVWELNLDISKIPTTDEETSLITTLAKNYFSKIPDEKKQRAIDFNWILGRTKKIPGRINAIVSFYLKKGRNETHQYKVKEFVDSILKPFLIENDDVTSIYRGTGRNFPGDYLSRISCDVEDLFNLVSAIHDKADEIKLGLFTQTYIVVQKFTSLSIEEIFRIEPLAEKYQIFIKDKIRKEFEDDDLIKFNTLSVENKIELIDSYDRLEKQLEVYSIIPKTAKNGYTKEKLVKDIIINGMYFFYAFEESRHMKNCYKKICTIHNEYFSETEEILTNLVSEIEKDTYSKYKIFLGIQSQRDPNQLTYTEKIKTYNLHCKSVDGLKDNQKDFKKLFQTNTYRNNVSHHSAKNRLKILDLGLAKFIDNLYIHLGFQDNYDMGEVKTGTNKRDDDIPP